MKKLPIGVLLLATTLLCAPVPSAAQSLGEMFQAVKDQVRGGEWARALATLDTLENEVAKPGHEDARGKLEGPIAFYRGVCRANEGQQDRAVDAFESFLVIQPDAMIDPALYSKPAVEAFEIARRAAAHRTFTLARAYDEFRMPLDVAERDPVDMRWADGPVRWIMTAEEKQEWSGLTDPNARAVFAEAFWTSRATLPGGAEGRTFRQEFERRVAFADAFLPQGGELRGSMTDRGMVFVLLGPPRYASRRKLRAGDDPSEPAGQSRVGSQDAKLALKPGGDLRNVAKRGTGGGKAVLWSWFQGAEHRAAIDDSDEELEVWNYDVQRLPKGIPYQQVDVHYVTKKGSGNRSIQRDAPTTNTLGAAARQARPVARPAMSAARR